MRKALLSLFVLLGLASASQACHLVSSFGLVTPFVPTVTVLAPVYQPPIVQQQIIEQQAIGYESLGFRSFGGYGINGFQPALGYSNALAFGGIRQVVPVRRAFIAPAVVAPRVVPRAIVVPRAVVPVRVIAPIRPRLFLGVGLRF